MIIILNIFIYFLLNSQVQMPSTNQQALDVLCGSDGAEFCTPQKWFDFMGDVNVPAVPFQINYLSGDEPVDGFTPYNPSTRACNVGTAVSIFSVDQ